MRIVAGTARGRTLKGPKGTGLRPTSDRVRESVFNILGQFFDGLCVLDLYAGTGALALEALSRGAQRAVLVDNGREAVRLCRENAQELSMETRAEIVNAAVDAKTLARLSSKGPFHLIFADPPYAAQTPEKLVDLIGEAKLLAQGGWLVVEHDKRSEAPSLRAGLFREDQRRFGDTEVSFYRCASAADSSRADLDGQKAGREHDAAMTAPSTTAHTVIYPGSFDPLTNGHLSLINRALLMFDKVIVAIAHNPKKTALFTVEERLALIREAVNSDPRVELDAFEGLLVNYARLRNVKVIMRGLRAVSDFEYEFQMANMNRTLDKGIETVFVMTGEDYYYISSQIVREVAALGGDVASLVPANVLAKLKERFRDGPGE